MRLDCYKAGIYPPIRVQPSSDTSIFHTLHLSFQSVFSESFSVTALSNTMVNVAVAGGTGGVGKTIVEAFKEFPQHKVFVLARKVPFLLSALGDIVLIRARLPQL